MSTQTLNKILILGDSGRGKSVLASKISEKFNIPFYSTDDYLYDVKFATYKDKQKSLEEISKVYQSDKWIVEGATHFLLKSGLELADIIIYLKYNNIFSQWATIINRSFKRKDESPLKTLWLIWHVLYKRFQTKKSRLKLGQMTNSERLEPHKHKVITLTSYNEIDEFVDSI